MLELIRRLFRQSEEAKQETNIEPMEIECEDSLLIRFYRNEPVAGENRKLYDIWQWPDPKLEGVHDYIQWMFPSMIASELNPDVPVLTLEDIEQFKDDTSLSDAITRSFEVFIKFLGLSVVNSKVIKAENFNKRARHWLTKNNHNYLRISRVLQFLILVDKRSEAEGFFIFLTYLKSEHPDLLTEPHSYWSKCINSHAN